MYDFEPNRSALHSGYIQSSTAVSSADGGNSSARTFVGASTGINPALAHWLMQSLDHVGRGMLLVGEGGQVLHANRLARSVLAGGSHVLQINQGRLCMANTRDDKLLQEAIHAAMFRGLRRMLTLGRSAAAAVGSKGRALTVAVLPIEDPTTGNAVLISLPQTSRSKDLAVQIFAREQGCTGAETAVLEALLAGQTPEAIAQAKQVALCTVRTQIGQLRLKTGSHTIRELLDRVAGLPPMMVVVQ